METSDAATASRIILAPVFFFVFFLPRWFGVSPSVSTIVLWVLFVAIESSDLTALIRARRRHDQIDSSKLLAPFADSLTRLTYFVCFTMAGFMPVWIFLILLYRDLAVGFVRFMVLRRGAVLTERLSGNFKIAFYSIAGIVGMLELSRRAFFASWGGAELFSTIMHITFYATGVIAVWSLVDYLMVLFGRAHRDASEHDLDH